MYSFLCDLVMPMVSRLSDSTFSFMSGLRKDELYEEDFEENSQHSKEQAFSFEQDASDIYSAFLAVYGIDIQEVEYMHWYKFRTLFDSLPGETEIKRKIHYRTMDANQIKDKDERARVRSIQDKIRIKDKKKKDIDDYEIGDMFW